MSSLVKIDKNFLPSENLLKTILNSSNVLILGHQNPDGDALGSTTALALALMQLGKKADIFISGFYSDSLDFLMTKKINFVDLTKKKIYDLIFLVDCNELERLGSDKELIENYLNLPNKDLKFIIIDHHLISDDFKKDDFWLHNTKASSAGELVYHLLKALNINFSFPIVQSLLTSIISDTGSFSQNNTSKDSLIIAADLISLGAKVDVIHNHLFRSNSFKKMLLLGQSLGSLQLHANGKIATIFLTNEMLDSTGAYISDSQGFVDYPRNIKGVELAAFMRVTSENNVKVSMRSQEGIDAATVAEQFKGGGHKQAAAYIVNFKEPQDALESFLTAVLKYSGIKG